MPLYLLGMSWFQIWRADLPQTDFECIGGPLDGGVIQLDASRSYKWCNGSGDGRRVHIYQRRLDRRSGIDVLEYEGCEELPPGVTPA